MVVWVDVKLNMSQQYALEAKRANCVLDASSTALPAGQGSYCPALHCIGVAPPGVLCAVLCATILEEHKIISERQEEGD